MWFWESFWESSETTIGKAILEAIGITMLNYTKQREYWVSTHKHTHIHTLTESVSWEFRGIVLITVAIRDSDVKWGQTCDLPVFMSSVGTQPDGSVPQSSQSQRPIPATVVDGDVSTCPLLV